MQAEGCSKERMCQELLVNLNPTYCTVPGFHRLTCKLYKCIKKAVTQKQIRCRVKEVQKFVNKGSWFWQETGMKYKHHTLERSNKMARASS